MIMLSTVPQDTDRMNFPTATARLNHTYALPTRNPTNYKRPSKVECLRQYILNILADASLYILSTPDVVRMSNIVTQKILIITLFTG